ncbi:c-type cytochrome [Aequorivita lipolytica]|uniref:C-type cytochrome n=1 Tax=Aequorivita lipolytica TaxID=153267 RepID=A0A5C6YU29_9FLAO|nr:c-type cytochrome [Aequorivita lipolytica]TXD70981.1 c-type cytochrome [Aequorivita lipolytica]
MKKVNFTHLRSKLPLLLLVFLLTFSTSIHSQDAPVADTAVASDSAGGDVAAGESLFKANCAACHKMDKKAVGPALRGVGEKYDRDWLYKWINNSQALIASGDALAVKLFEENNKAVMTAFPALSETDIDNILAYTDQPKAEPVAAAGVETTTTAASNDGGSVSNTLVIGALLLIFLLLVIMLFLVTNTLKKIAEANGVVYEEKEKRTPIWKAFIQNQFLVLVFSIFLLLSGAYFGYGYFMQVGVDQGYAPVQPIHYSHRIHAGENQIDCNFCHSSARKSKHSGIPSLNVCMNCHKNIAEVAPETATEEYSKEFYDGEIAKLYKAVGWDAENQEYTGKTEPVKWIRIHNLPDFAYFNHSQHVTVAGIACQTCHGEIQEMEIVEQFAPLTMGWCINCHRETNVNLATNDYYAKIHEELSKKYGIEKLTIAEMGGLECGKCHY